MRIGSGFIFLKKLLTKRTWYPLKGLAIAVLVLVLSGGCSKTPLQIDKLPVLLPEFSTNANFQLRVEPSKREGFYTVTGTTNLPDESPIAVAAIRHLRPPDELPPSPSSKPTYSILAYQDVKVSQGKWQATLNLWKVAPDGRFQEAWQLEQSQLGLKFDPDKDVTFLATLAPTDPLWAVEQRLEKQGIKLVTTLIRNTVDGERYVQASEALSVPLPTASTAPPPQRPEELNGGWGPRYILLPEPPNKKKFEQPKDRRIDAPLAPAEFMQ